MFNYMFLMGDRMCGKSYFINEHTDIIYIREDSICHNTAIRPYIDKTIRMTKFFSLIEKSDIPQLENLYFAVDWNEFYYNRDRFFNVIKKIVDNKKNLVLIILCNSREYFLEMSENGYISKFDELHRQSTGGKLKEILKNAKF